MKVVLSIVCTLLLFGCSISNDNDIEAISLKLPTHISNFEGTGFKVDIKQTQTKSELTDSEVFELCISDDDSRKQVIVYMKVKFFSDLIKVEDFSVEHGLLATHYYSYEGKQLDLEINFKDTKGWFSDWWGCTNHQCQIQQKRGKDFDESMVGGIIGDWLPTNTIRAAASGLYCMGNS